MDQPRYGTEAPDTIPIIHFKNKKKLSNDSNSSDADASSGNGFARLLAGSAQGLSGPFKTVSDVQMLDVVLPGMFVLWSFLFLFLFLFLFVFLLFFV